MKITVNEKTIEMAINEARNQYLSFKEWEKVNRDSAEDFIGWDFNKIFCACAGKEYEDDMVICYNFTPDDEHYDLINYVGKATSKDEWLSAFADYCYWCA